MNSCYILFLNSYCTFIQLWSVVNCFACVPLSFFRLLIIIWWCLDSSTADAIRWWAVLNACVEKKTTTSQRDMSQAFVNMKFADFLAILIYENEKEMFNNSTLLCFIALSCVAFYTYIHFGRTSNANYFRFVIYSERTEEEEPMTRETYMWETWMGG